LRLRFTFVVLAGGSLSSSFSSVSNDSSGCSISESGGNLGISKIKKE
jgi:hypothetical protein